MPNDMLTLPQIIKQGNILLNNKKIKDAELDDYLKKIKPLTEKITSDLKQLETAQDNEKLKNQIMVTVKFSKILFDQLGKIDHYDQEIKYKIRQCQFVTMALAIDSYSDYCDILKNDYQFMQKFFESLLDNLEMIDTFVKNEAQNIPDKDKSKEKERKLRDKITAIDYLIEYIPQILIKTGIKENKGILIQRIQFQAHVTLSNIYLNKILFQHRCQDKNIDLPITLDITDCFKKAQDNLQKSIQHYLPSNREPETIEERRIYILFLFYQCEYYFTKIKINKITQEEKANLQREFLLAANKILTNHSIMKDSQNQQTNEKVKDNILILLEKILSISTGDLILTFQEKINEFDLKIKNFDDYLSPQILMHLYFAKIKAKLTFLEKLTSEINSEKNEEEKQKKIKTFSESAELTTGLFNIVESMIFTLRSESSPYDFESMLFFNYKFQFSLIKTDLNETSELIFDYCYANTYALTNTIKSNDITSFSNDHIEKLIENNIQFIARMVTKYKNIFPDELLAHLQKVSTIEELPQQISESIKFHLNEVNEIILCQLMSKVIILKDKIKNNLATIKKFNNGNLLDKQDKEVCYKIIQSQYSNIQRYLQNISEFGMNFAELSKILTYDIIESLATTIELFDYIHDANSHDEIELKTFLHTALGICINLHANFIEQCKNPSEVSLETVESYRNNAIEHLLFSLFLYNSIFSSSNEKILPYEEVLLLKSEIFFELAKISLQFSRDADCFSQIKKYFIQSLALLNAYSAFPELRTFDKDYLEKRSELFFTIATNYYDQYPKELLSFIDDIKKQLNPLWHPPFNLKLPMEFALTFEQRTKEAAKKRRKKGKAQSSQKPITRTKKPIYDENSSDDDDSTIKTQPIPESTQTLEKVPESDSKLDSVNVNPLTQKENDVATPKVKSLKKKGRKQRRKEKEKKEKSLHDEQHPSNSTAQISEALLANNDHGSLPSSPSTSPKLDPTSESIVSGSAETLNSEVEKENPNHEQTIQYEIFQKALAEEYDHIDERVKTTFVDPNGNIFLAFPWGALAVEFPNEEDWTTEVAKKYKKEYEGVRQIAKERGV